MRSYLLFKNIFKKAKIYSCSVKDKYFDKNVYNSSIIGKATIFKEYFLIKHYIKKNIIKETQLFWVSFLFKYNF